MKPHRVLDTYFEVYGQADQITPEAGEKRLLLPWPFLAYRVAISENANVKHSNMRSLPCTD